MQTIQVQLKTGTDFELLSHLLTRMGLSWKQSDAKQDEVRQDTEKKAFWSAIKNGCSESSIDDPVQWQREQRKDRNMPERS